MTNQSPRKVIDYEQEAVECFRRQTLEDKMKSPAQSKQKHISEVSFELIHRKRPAIQAFGNLLIQYPNPDPTADRPGQVAPHNFVCVHDELLKLDLSYVLEHQPVRPFWVFEYASPKTHHKDPHVNVHKYEHDLRMPYFLLFNTDTKELVLYRHMGANYIAVAPNRAGRYSVPELEIEVALLDGWVRFWFRGQLKPLLQELHDRLLRLQQRSA